MTGKLNLCCARLVVCFENGENTFWVCIRCPKALIPLSLIPVVHSESVLMMFLCASAEGKNKSKHFIRIFCAWLFIYCYVLCIEKVETVAVVSLRFLPQTLEADATFYLILPLFFKEFPLLHSNLVCRVSFPRLLLLRLRYWEKNVANVRNENLQSPLSRQRERGFQKFYYWKLLQLLSSFKIRHHLFPKKGKKGDTFPSSCFSRQSIRLESRGRRFKCLDITQVVNEFLRLCFDPS